MPGKKGSIVLRLSKDCLERSFSVKEKAYYRLIKIKNRKAEKGVHWTLLDALVSLDKDFDLKTATTSQIEGMLEPKKKDRKGLK
jgi:hypothetical protein